MKDLTEDTNQDAVFAIHHKDVTYKDGKFCSHEGSKGIEWVIKPSVITSYKFSDSGIVGWDIGGGVLTIHNPELTTNLDKGDVIEITKALGVTADDLK